MVEVHHILGEYKGSFVVKNISVYQRKFWRYTRLSLSCDVVGKPLENRQFGALLFRVKPPNFDDF